MFRAKAWVTTDQAVDFATFNEWLVSGSGFTLPAPTTLFQYPPLLHSLPPYQAAGAIKLPASPGLL